MRRRVIGLKRVYEQASASDGTRVLVDRLWPRGLSRQEVCADLWLKEAAPSPGLRRWFGHDPGRWRQFSRRYRDELERRPGVLELLDDLRKRSRITLIFGARDQAHSHAVVLREVLNQLVRPSRMPRKPGARP